MPTTVSQRSMQTLAEFLPDGMLMPIAKWCAGMCPVTATRPEMSDIGLRVLGMTEPPSRYDVTITVDHGGGTPLLGLAEFATEARQAASRRGASGRGRLQPIARLVMTHSSSASG